MSTPLWIVFALSVGFALGRYFRTYVFQNRGIRYFPRSGNVVLPVAQLGEHFADTKKSYLYLNREQPQPLLHHPSYAWRGPGIYFVTGDHRIKGQWFIHHDRTVAVAFAPY